MRPLIIGNWKCNPASLTEAKKLFGSVAKGVKNIKKVEVIICPPFVWLSNLLTPKPHILNPKLGAQDCFWDGQGAFTGEVSPAMLKDLGVKYVILGHSERRRYLGETDEMINRKVKAVTSAGLIPILCVGSLKKGEEGRKKMEIQLKRALTGIKKPDIKSIVFTYEPIWAISTTKGGLAVTPENAKENAIFIRKILKGLLNNFQKVKVIYGGSVDSMNIQGFIKEAGMDGALIGAASLRLDDFIKAVLKIDKIRKS